MKKTIINLILSAVIILCACGIIIHYATPYVQALERSEDMEEYLASETETSEAETFILETPAPIEEIEETPAPTEPTSVQTKKAEDPKRLRAADIFSENTMGYVTIGDLKIIMGYGDGKANDKGVVEDLEGQCFLNLQSDANNLVIKGHCYQNIFLPLYWQKEGSIITVQFDASVDEVTRYEVVKLEWLSDEEYLADSCAAVYENEYDVTFVTCKKEKQDGEKIHGCLLVRCMKVE